ncbi:hypothetical protein OAO01_07175 [Oligoflexia bacterium]|nr:hypothetical protein [Oligoflexia bacterium]
MIRIRSALARMNRFCSRRRFTVTIDDGRLTIDGYDGRLTGTMDD